MLSIENFKINDQEIKTYLGLTRLCKHFFNNSICFNKEKCNYKHSLNFQEPFASIQDKQKIK